MITKIRTVGGTLLIWIMDVLNCMSLSLLHKMTYESGQWILMKGSSHVVPLLRSEWSFLLCYFWQLNDPFCCIHRSRESQCFSVGRTSCENWPFPWGMSTLSNTWFLGPPEKARQTTSQLVRPFLQGTCMWPTETDRVTDCSNRQHLVYCVHAVWPNNIITV